MRCYCCNRNLSDFEATLKHAITGDYLDTCNKCLTDLDIPAVGRADLNPYETFEDEDTVLEEEEDEAY